MSNYVANYVFCNEELYNGFLYNSFGQRFFQEGMYDPAGYVLDSERRLLIFETRGMEYKNEAIEKVISRYHDVIWNCVEENHVEEGCFYWDGEKVSGSVRPLQESCDDCYFTIEYEDPLFRGFKIIMGFPDRIVEENFVTNTRREFYLSEFASSQIMSFMNDQRTRIIQESSGHEFPSYTGEDIWDEYGFWGADRFCDNAGVCRLDSDQIKGIDEEELKKGALIIKEVRNYLEEYFRKYKIDIQLSYKEVREFAMGDRVESVKIKELERIHGFAVEYRDKYQDPETRECEVEDGFAERCREFGFVMDCGERFAERYSKEAFQDYRDLEDIAVDIEDIDILGSAIFSYWRGVTHWSYSQLLEESNRRWFAIAFDRLSALTDPYKDKPFSFDGRLTRVTIKSDSVCYGPCPKPDDEVMQELIIIDDGRVWVTRYNYGEGYPYEIKDNRRYDVSTASVQKIFAAILNYFKSNRSDTFVTDVGSWEIFLNDDLLRTFKASGSMGSDLYSEYGGLSEIIRAELSIPDLFVFDGNNG